MITWLVINQMIAACDLPRHRLREWTLSVVAACACVAIGYALVYALTRSMLP